tara:strand:- start:433 stop:1728 length:1296 start_codon:yes stop_codon:yes gene_type:complete
MLNKILKKIKNKNIVIAIVGLGFVGLPLCVRFINSGNKVLGIDQDYKKINLIKKGISYISSIKNNELNYFKKYKNNVSTKLSKLSEADVIIICLPTPLKYNSKTPDMSYVFNFARSAKKYLKPGHTVILESTVYPGATEELLNKLKKQNLKIGENFFLIYSPERENPGYKKINYKNIPKICSGISKNCLLISRHLYANIVKKTVLASTTRSAEMSKLLENVYRAVNIGLVNEIKIICNEMNININEVINNSSTKPFGFTKFLPGPGIGGHCIPIDPYYLSWASKNYNYNPVFIKAAGDINASMPRWIVSKVVEKIRKQKKNKCLVIGIAYKKDVNDDRESPAYEIIHRLRKLGIKVDYHDPYIKKKGKNRKYNYELSSVNLSAEKLKFYNFVVLVTDHSCLNYKMILKHSKLIFDSRGAFNRFNSKKVISC